MFDVGRITANWAETKGLNIFYFDEVASTARWVHQQSADRFFQPTMVVASHQTAGRGRTEERVWVDAQAGTSLCANWVTPLWRDLPQPPFTEEIGRQLLQCVKEVFPNLDWSLKLPNDLLLEKKKCAGLLVEVIQQKPPSLLSIGLGFNVFAAPTQFDATHLSAHQPITPELWTHLLEKISYFLFHH